MVLNTKFFIILIAILPYALLIKSSPDEIKMRDNINKIKNAITNDKKFKYHAYEQIAYLVDVFGPRLYGSKSLELATNHMEKLLINSKFENVKQEEVEDIPVWKRGKEKLTLYSPRIIPASIPLIGFGLSVSSDIKTEVIVIEDYHDFKAQSDKIKGKIVLINQKWKSKNGGKMLGQMWGAIESAKYGAVGILVRSLTPKSIESPHTGLI
jgi:carboxypeptidase Q